jgi:hypothetical protein
MQFLFTVYKDISACQKVSKFKIPEICEEISANHASVEFNNRLVDIYYARGKFSNFCQYAKFAIYFCVANLTTYIV